MSLIDGFSPIHYLVGAGLLSFFAAAATACVSVGVVKRDEPLIALASFPALAALATVLSFIEPV